MFELALAADLKLQGADVTLGEPDITVFLDRTQFLIECKRPVPEHSIRANVRGAVHQLNAKLDENGRKEAHGIVAISVSRILNPGTSIFVAPANAGRGKLGDQLGMLMRHHESDWKKSGAHKRITAVLFQAVTPAAIGDEQGHGISLVRLSYMTVMPTDTDETGFAPVERNFPTLLNY